MKCTQPRLAGLYCTVHVVTPQLRGKESAGQKWLKRTRSDYRVKNARTVGNTCYVRSHAKPGQYCQQESSRETANWLEGAGGDCGLQATVGAPQEKQLENGQNPLRDQRNHNPSEAPTSQSYSYPVNRRGRLEPNNAMHHHLRQILPPKRRGTDTNAIRLENGIEWTAGKRHRTCAVGRTRVAGSKCCYHLVLGGVARQLQASTLVASRTTLHGQSSLPL